MNDIAHNHSIEPPFQCGFGCPVFDEKSREIIGREALEDRTDEKTVVQVQFGPESNNWSHFPEYNLIFLRQITNYLNNLLQVRGHVFLNEVFDELGIKRTPEGAIMGWLHNPDRPNPIDFEVWDGPAEKHVLGTQKDDQDRVVTGQPLSITLVTDGVIYQQI